MVQVLLIGLLVAAFHQGWGYMFSLRLREAETTRQAIASVCAVFAMNAFGFFWIAIGVIGPEANTNGTGQLIALAIVAFLAAVKTFFYDMRPPKKEKDHAARNIGHDQGQQRRQEGDVPRSAGSDQARPQAR